jgi:hypothetical protein
MAQAQEGQPSQRSFDDAYEEMSHASSEQRRLAQMTQEQRTREWRATQPTAPEEMDWPELIGHEAGQALRGVPDYFAGLSPVGFRSNAQGATDITQPYPRIPPAIIGALRLGGHAMMGQPVQVARDLAPIAQPAITAGRELGALGSAYNVPGFRGAPPVSQQEMDQAARGAGANLTAALVPYARTGLTRMGVPQAMTAWSQTASGAPLVSQILKGVGVPTIRDLAALVGRGLLDPNAVPKPPAPGPAQWSAQAPPPSSVPPALRAGRGGIIGTQPPVAPPPSTPPPTSMSVRGVPQAAVGAMGPTEKKRAGQRGQPPR